MKPVAIFFAYFIRNALRQKEKYILIFIFSSLSHFLLGQSNSLVWAKQMGGSSVDISNAVIVDGSGNVYTTGYFQGTADFDPGPGTYNLSSVGNSDIFISKIDVSGNFIWAKQLGGIDNEMGYSIAFDLNGNIYLTGEFLGTCDFDPGPAVFNLTSFGFEDLFVAKFESSGNFIWAKQIGGSLSDKVRSIATDQNGNVYTTGRFNGTADFDPNPSIYNLTSIGGAGDVFVSKLNSTGDFIWAKQIGGLSDEFAHSITIDSYSNVYTTGYFQGTTDFDPGSSIYNLTSLGSYDIFISRLDASGNFVWARQMGGSNLEKGNSIKVDNDGNVYTTGQFHGTVDFDPGYGVYNLISAGAGDVFVSKLNSTGDFIWAKQMGGSSTTGIHAGDIGFSINIDSDGSIYTTGGFVEIADFDPGSSVYNLTSSGNYDIFICKLSSSGSFISAIQAGGTSHEQGNSIAVDANGNIYTTGSFVGTCDFDPGSGIINLISAGVSDVFVLKLGGLESTIIYPPNFLWAKQLGGTSNDESFSTVTDKYGNVFTTGYFNGMADFDPGPGTFNLTSVGSTDIFISKLDASGNFLWAKQIGGPSGDMGLSIAIDINGNVYASGFFGGTADFDPGVGSFNLTSAGGVDIFISKLDSSGNFILAKQLGGVDDDYGHAITVDSNGNVYTTGIFKGTSDFDPGVGVYNLLSFGAFWDVFVSKLNTSGDFVWAKQMGGTENDYGYSISVDKFGNVYTTGWLKGTADFDPGPGLFNLTSFGNFDVFISKLDENGDYVWAKQIGGINDDRGYSLKVDSDANVYLTGFFQATADFDPGNGIYNLTATNIDFFISKIDASGNFIWAKQMSGATGSNSSIAIDQSHNVFIAGTFAATSDFNPGIETYNLTAVGGTDVFACKLNPLGQFVWASQFGGIGEDRGYSIAIDSNSNLYISGMFSGTADFDPSNEAYNMTSLGGSDIFIVKMGDPVVTEYPQIFIDRVTILQGESVSVSGRNFSPSGQIDITITKLDEKIVIIDTTIIANSQGIFNQGFSFDIALAPGFYSIKAIDNVRAISAYEVRLNILSTNPSILRNLRITAPVLNASYKVNIPIRIGWSDKPKHISTLIPNTSKVNAVYKLEYNKDNTGWQLITLLTTPAIFQQWGNFQYYFTPQQIGNYLFRVTDNFDPLNTDSSELVSINDPISSALLEYRWDYSGNRPSKLPTGVTADGTARIYIKVLKKETNNKTISSVSIGISDPNNPAITDTRLLGKLMIASDTASYSLQGNAANTTTVVSSNSGSGNVFWFWYVAPDDFTRTSDDNDVEIRDLKVEASILYSDNTSEIISDKIEIVRPPLMFVHGLGGDEMAWNDLFYSWNNSVRHFIDKESSPWMFCKPLHMYPDGSFIKNAQLLLTLSDNGFNLFADQIEHYNPNSFQSFLQQMRNYGYSSNRVDYIAHSMGGAMARTVINLYSSPSPLNNFQPEYKPTVALPRKFKNYDQGFINRLITVNTPHNGSPFADLLIEKLSKHRIFRILLNATRTADWAKIAHSFFNTNPLNSGYNFDSPTEAIKNLRSGDLGVKFNSTSVKNHLIAGDIVVEGDDCELIYRELKKGSDVKLMLKILEYFLKSGDNCSEINNLLTPYGYPNFFDNGDVVVPLSSQLPGKILTGSGVDYTIYYGKNSNHLSILNSNLIPSVGQKVFELLNSPINNTIFSSSISANPNNGPITYRNNFINNSNEYEDTTKIVITSPIRGTSHFVDSSINIFVRLKDTTHFKRLNILFQSEIYTSESKASSQIFKVQIDPILVDTQTIVATATYDSLGTEIYYTDTLSLVVAKDTAIRGFQVRPNTKHLNNTQNYIPSYNLIHNSYITNVSVQDTALHITVADTNVVRFSNIQKCFIAKDTGTTYAIISYKEYKDTLFLIIDTASFNPGPPLPVNLTSFIGTAKKDYNNLEWETVSEVSFSHFVLQKSLNGTTWHNIASINSRANTINSLTRYDYKDSLIKADITFYRLQIVDMSGSFKYSHIVILRRDNNRLLRVFPNPVFKNEVFIDFGQINGQIKASFKLYDLNGRCVRSINQNSNNSNLIRLDLAGLKPSIYILSIETGTVSNKVKLVLID